MEITVQVGLHGLAVQRCNRENAGSSLEVALPEGAILWDLMKDLGLVRSGMLTSVNGIKGRPDSQLSQGDKVEIFMLMTGG